VARELSVSSDRQGGGGGRNPRPYSGSRYKYLGFKRGRELRRTSYAGETVIEPESEKRLRPASASEPKLFRKQTVMRGRARVRGEVCSNPRGEEPGEETEEESREVKAKLTRMKAQSRKTFKFRKTRKQRESKQTPEVVSPSQVATIGGEWVPAAQPAKVKSTSMTAAMLRRARQGKKPPPQVEICIDDDSISSARTSSTVGYRDSFGENDDGCFHLLERYDDNNAVVRLLQSRRKTSKEPPPPVPAAAADTTLEEEECTTPSTMADSGPDESSEQDTSTVTNYVIFEQRDEDTLI